MGEESFRKKTVTVNLFNCIPEGSYITVKKRRVIVKFLRSWLSTLVMSLTKTDNFFSRVETYNIRSNKRFIPLERLEMF